MAGVLVAFIVIIGLLMVSIVVIAIVAAVNTRRRLREFLAHRAHLAGQLGWRAAAPDPWLTQVAAGTFQRGRPGEMAIGPYRDRTAFCLDYTYVTQSSGANGQSSSQTHHVHLVALLLPAALPQLALTPENGVVRLFAGRDLELESPQFNRTFRITCNDDRFASAVLHPRMMELCLANPGLQWQVAGSMLVAWGTGYWTVPDATAKLDVLSRILDLMPSFVMRDYGR